MVFLFVFIFIIVILIILSNSKIVLEISNLKFNTENPKHINKDNKFVIKIYILEKIPILSIKMEETTFKKFDIEAKLKNKKIDKSLLKELIKVKYKINNINLKIMAGTEEADQTALLIPVITTIISMIIRKNAKKESNIFFRVDPLYYNKNLLYIEFSSIIEFKMRHIISIMYKFSKKEGVKNNERTSNRRSYGYSYE